MSEENTTQENQGGEAGADLGNIKEEFNRKIGNVSQSIESQQSKIDQVLAQNQALIESLNAQGQSRKVDEGSNESLGDLLFSNPDEAISKIAQEVAKTVKTDVSKDLDTRAAQSQTLNQLVTEFPELSDEGHALSKEAVDIYKGLPQNDPNSYRLAVMQAALNQGVQPRSKRSGGSDDYVMQGGSRGSERTKSNKSDKLDEGTLAFAQLVGMDISDEKVLKNLKKHSKRNFGKYQ